MENMCYGKHVLDNMFYGENVFLLPPNPSVRKVLKNTAQVFVIGSFLTYGSDWIKYILSNETYTNKMDSPMDKLFPKMAACEVKQWGASGQDEDNGRESIQLIIHYIIQLII